MEMQWQWAYFLSYSINRILLGKQVEVGLKLFPLSPLLLVTHVWRTAASWNLRMRNIAFISDKHWPKSLPSCIPSKGGTVRTEMEHT